MAQIFKLELEIAIRKMDITGKWVAGTDINGDLWTSNIPGDDAISALQSLFYVLGGQPARLAVALEGGHDVEVEVKQLTTKGGNRNTFNPDIRQLAEGSVVDGSTKERGSDPRMPKGEFQTEIR